VHQKQPNSHHCFACGLDNPHGLHLRFTDNGIDEVYCETRISDAFNGYPGVAHGGVVAAMLDEVVIRTAMIADPNRFMMTARLELKYRRPVPTNTPLKLTGKLVRDRGRILQAEGRIELPDGTVAVEAAITAADLPGGFEVNEELLQALGWKVYD
jgi:acyl-coenzyme A thioesterase PaaI-like protein